MRWFKEEGQWCSMIVLSYNVCGLGGSVKKIMVKELVFNHKVDFLAIQQTKLEVITNSLCHNLWGSDDCEWAFLPSIGNSGGILSIWRKSNSSLLFSFTGEGFMRVCLEWGVHKKRCFVVNVYFKCNLLPKKRLWDSLVLVKNTFGDLKWCVIGDFNAVTCAEERRGINDVVSPGIYSEMNFFNNFLLDVELLDLNPLGRNFTWHHPNGSCMSRNDRALASEGWRSCWGSTSLWVVPRSISDHCPLVLKSGDLDWGPKLFRFNNYWLENRNFKKVVEEVWRTQRGVGWMGVILKNKLKGLKEELRVWSKKEYEDLNFKAEKLIEEIVDLDVKGGHGMMSGEEVEVRKKKFEEMWRLLRCKNASMV